MGEVYRATDSNLKRQVAIKVLPASLAGDAERLARFQREAEVLAALNHPNIAAIYGLERANGQTALLMELVEGPTLADRIAQGAIPMDEALPIAKQIARLSRPRTSGASSIATSSRPISRSAKTAWSRCSTSGCRKPRRPRARWRRTLSQSPTMTSPALTEAGVILGTAAYMSPEQARGKGVDTRSDIWGFGCVLYEMLTGQRAFAGQSVSDTLARVIEREPDWARLPTGLSPALRTYVGRCLHKDSRQRVQAIGDVRLALEGAFETPGPATAAPAGCGVAASRSGRCCGDHREQRACGLADVGRYAPAATPRVASAGRVLG